MATMPLTRDELVRRHPAREALRDTDLPIRYRQIPLSAKPGVRVFPPPVEGKLIERPDRALLSEARRRAMPRATIMFNVPHAGRYKIVLDCRICFPGLLVTVESAGAAILHCELPYTGHDRNFLFVADTEFQAGENEIGLSVQFPESQTFQGIYLLLHRSHATFNPA